MTAGTPITTGAGWVNALAISSSGTIYEADPDGNVYKIVSGAVTATITPGAVIGNLAIYGNTLYAGASGSGNVYPINITTNAVGTTITTGASTLPYVNSIVVSTGGMLYAGDGSYGNLGTIYLKKL